jgi:hypothetical protein
MEETDRLLLCDHCRVKLYLSSDRFFSYLLPPSVQGSKEVLFAPYWRVKGILFSCEGHEIVHKVVDASVQAGELQCLPMSLGYRPQALRLRFVLSETPGRFLQTTMPLQRVRAMVHGGISVPEADLPPSEGYYQVILGETVSTIHAPFFLQGNTLVDAILDRPVCSLDSAGLRMMESASPAPEDRLRFVATLCPQCGWDLQGDKDSHVLLCANCDSAWQAAQAAMVRVASEVFPGGDADSIYLPFWRIKVALEGMSLRSFADLVRLANLPKAIKAAWEEQECYLWSPAFKIRPKAFLQAARAMTLAQPQGAREGALPKNQIYPVTFPSSEAAGAIKIILAHIAVAKTRVFPLLSGIRIGSPEFVLAYLPFTVRPNELIQEQWRFSIDRSTVQFGRKL